MSGTTTEVLNVEGMSCMHCVHAVKSAVGGMKGVANVDVDLANKKVAVAFDKDLVKLNQIKDSIRDAGYEVK